MIYLEMILMLLLGITIGTLIVKAIIITYENLNSVVKMSASKALLLGFVLCPLFTLIDIIWMPITFCTNLYIRLRYGTLRCECGCMGIIKQYKFCGTKLSTVICEECGRQSSAFGTTRSAVDSWNKKEYTIWHNLQLFAKNLRLCVM